MLIPEQQMKLGQSISDDMVYAWEPYEWTKDTCPNCSKKTMFKCENDATICAYCDFSPELGCDIDLYKGCVSA
jgi:hypothetical protein